MAGQAFTPYDLSHDFGPLASSGLLLCYFDDSILWVSAKYRKLSSHQGVAHIATKWHHSPVSELCFPSKTNAMSSRIAPTTHALQSPSRDVYFRDNARAHIEDVVPTFNVGGYIVVRSSYTRRRVCRVKTSRAGSPCSRHELQLSLDQLRSTNERFVRHRYHNSGPMIARAVTVQAVVRRA